VFVVTAMFNVAFVVSVPSLAWSVKLAAVAPQPATMFAVTVPAVFTMFERVTPFVGFELVSVTATPAAPLSLSVTVAMIELVPGEPCCRDRPTAAVIAGAEFTVRVKVWVASVPTPFAALKLIE
jgi:hypothetical protein